jgi:hypothetical protein
LISLNCPHESAARLTRQSYRALPAYFVEGATAGAGDVFAGGLTGLVYFGGVTSCALTHSRGASIAKTTGIAIKISRLINGRRTIKRTNPFTITPESNRYRAPVSAPNE